MPGLRAPPLVTLGNKTREISSTEDYVIAFWETPA